MANLTLLSSCAREIASSHGSPCFTEEVVYGRSLEIACSGPGSVPGATVLEVLPCASSALHLITVVRVCLLDLIWCDKSDV